MPNNRHLHWIKRAWANAQIIALVMLAAMLIRKGLLSSLGNRIVWVTFYPAVMAGALYGGWITGLLTAILSCFVAVYGWHLLASRPFINDGADWLGLAVFLGNCLFISLIADLARRARQKAVDACQQAEAANQAKSVFLSNMSHELRTPLNAILGFTRLLRAESGITDDSRKMLEIVDRSGEHLLQIINDILDMAKIEAGKMEVRSATCELSFLVQEVANLMRQRADSKGLRLDLELGLGLPAFVKTDGPKFRQILLNLVGNAIKFTNQGQVIIRIKQRTEPREDQIQLMLEVEDTGPGIPQAECQHIFEPFVQLGSVKQQKGTGLGLAITQQYAHLMGGRVEVESVLGKGSLFRVILPVERAETEPDSSHQPKLLGLARLAPGQPECRVLVAEDQPENRLLIKNLLERAGFITRVCEDGAECVEQTLSWQPHFVCLDWKMPVMDGLEAIRRIRATAAGRSIKMAVLSASAFDQDRKQILDAGADDYIAKPIFPGQIYECIAKHLGIKYVYDNADLKNEVAAANFKKEELGALPVDFLDGLCQALISLNPERIVHAINKVSEVNPELAQQLRGRASRLEYSGLLREVETVRNRSSSVERVA